MNKPTSFLVFLPALLALDAFAGAPAAANAAASHAPLPLGGVQPELVAALMVTAAAVAMALLLGRRIQSAEERSRTLEQQLEAERRAHTDVEDALAGSHEVLCRLVRQQEGVREAERCRIARELHDELGHRLLSLRVELALQQAAVRGTTPGVHDKLTLAIANLDGAIRSVRATVAGLRPIAPGVSLRQAAERHLADFARLHGLDYRLIASTCPEAQKAAGEASGPAAGTAAGQRDRDLDAVLYRALQEALSNVIRHADATMVCVTLIESAHEIVLKVEDDGAGPGPLPFGASEGGAGIAGMRERAQAFGGTIELAPGRRGGTVLCVTLPLPGVAVPA